jgi:hypothetical protein
VDLTVEQVLTLAPDASSAAAGRKLGTPKAWHNVGRSPAALWGECQGSAVYQVRVDLGDLSVKCSCPSRKFPCKHGLGLLVLAAGAVDALPPAEPPAWVTEWLTRRATSAEKRAAKARVPAAAASDANTIADDAQAARRADRRRVRVAAGLDALDRWLDDLVRNGLAAVESQPATFWEGQAARLVDAQAPGLAARVRRLAAIPHASPDWPARLLEALGRLALITQAFRLLDALDPALQEDVRAAIGWSPSQEEVAATGEVVTDDWLVLGQRVTVEERLRAQWTWLRGDRTGRAALVLQFAHGSAPFEHRLAPGTHQEADLTYWPSAWPQRALVCARRGSPAPICGPLPGAPDLAAFLDEVATATARHPWLERFPFAVCDVVPWRDEAGAWLVRDRAGFGLPLARGEHWRLLALSGGRPVDLTGEWDGEVLLPLGVMVDDAFHPLREER